MGVLEYKSNIGRRVVLIYIYKSIKREGEGRIHWFKYKGGYILEIQVKYREGVY